jgi:hypothetical protein
VSPRVEVRRADDPRASFVGRVIGHVRALWPRYAWLPPLPFAAYFTWMALRGTVRPEHVALLLLIPALAYATPATKRLCVGAYPMALVGLLYDAMKPIQNLGLSSSHVHVCEERARELAFFGLGAGSERITLQDYFHAHHATALDVLCAIPYGTYLFAAFGFAAYLYVRDYPAMRRFAWAFFALNLAGFITYHLYPAAPPWYVRAHGCAADLATHASEGTALARVDALMGVPYFAGMYGRASDVFGAMPSLHVGYPLLIVLAGWERFRFAGRAASLAFLASMCFAAVYLDHHWISDELVGLTYAATAFFVVGRALAEAPASSSPVTDSEGGAA